MLLTKKLGEKIKRRINERKKFGENNKGMGYFGEIKSSKTKRMS